MNEAVIVSAARTAAGKAPSGTLRTTRPDDMAATVIDAQAKLTGDVTTVLVSTGRDLLK